MSDFFSRLKLPSLSSLREILGAVSDGWLMVFGVILLAVVTVWLLLLVWRALEPAGSHDVGAAGGVDVIFLGRCPAGSAGDVRRAFERGFDKLQRFQSDPYAVPWFLALGETAAGKSTLLANNGLTLPLGEPEESSAVDWWIYDQAVVLEPQGDLVLRGDGRSNDEIGWQCFLRELLIHHRRRPLDGIFLTIPAHRLLAGARDQASLRSDAAVRANGLFQRLAELQQVLGMQLPVYVTVTQSDGIDGFGTFVTTAERLGEQAGDHLGGAVTDQMLGWSSPDSAEAPYQPSWLGTAIRSITDRITQIDLALLTAYPRKTVAQGGSEARARTSAFVGFADALAETQSALQIYLNHLFGSSSFVEPFFFRGLYYTGAVFAAPQPEVHGTQPGAARSSAQQGNGGAQQGNGSRTIRAIVFAKDIFTFKAFYEHALGRFTADRMARARRLRLIVMAVAVALPLFFFLGMVWAHSAVSEASTALLPLLAEIDVDYRTPQSQLTDAESARRAAGLVRHANRIERYRLKSFFLPASWVSPIDGNLAEVVRRSWQDYVFPALDRRLHSQARLLAAAPPPAPQRPRIVYLEEMPEFLQLEQFADGQAQLEQDAWLYDCLSLHCAQGGAALSVFDRLSTDLLRVQLRPPTLDAHRFYARLLDDATFGRFRFSVSEIAGLRTAADRDFAAFFDRAFECNVLRVDLGDLNRKIISLQDPTTGRALAAPNATIADYKQLDILLQRGAQDLERPELAWAAEPLFDPGPVYWQTLRKLAASIVYGPKRAEAQAVAAQGNLEILQGRLLALRNQSTGWILQRQRNQLILAYTQGVLDLQKAVANLLGQEFVTYQKPGRLKIPGAHERLIWDQSVLADIPQLFEDYQKFENTGVQPFPSDMRSGTRSTALQSLDTSVVDKLVAAQTFQPAPSRLESRSLERGLNTQVGNVNATAPTLAQTLDDLWQVGLHGTYTELAEVLTRAQTQSLDDLDALLGLQNLYSPVDPCPTTMASPVDGRCFASWTGDQPPSPTSFGQSSNDSLKAWLDSESDAATNLSKTYAVPLLESPTADHLLPDPQLRSLTLSWSSFVADVDAKVNQVPGNPLSSLETLISTTLTALTLESCFDEIPRNLSCGDSDFFVARNQCMQASLRARCTELASELGIAGYRRYAQLFDERLAGRYPFADAGPSSTDYVAVEATPPAIREFYRLFDQSADLVPHIPPGDPGFGPSEAGARAFVAQMQEVRGFLATFLDQPDKYPTPVFAFDVAFRVNRSNEAGGDQIITWGLQAGNVTLTTGVPQGDSQAQSQSGASGASTAGDGADPPSATTPTALGGQWLLGNDVEVSLRWASDAPVRPDPSPANGPVQRLEDPQTVVWEYDNLWSLIALVEEHQAPPAALPGFTDVQPQTLRFIIPTQPADGGTSTTADAVVFDRVTLYTPDRASELLVPTFPSSAPPLTIPDFVVSVSGRTASFEDRTRGLVDTRRWTFGDGQGTAGQKNPTHTYDKNGTYTAVLTTTTTGISHSRSHQVVVDLEPAPDANFSFAIDGLDVTFTDRTTGNPTAWSWSFGDGQTSTEQNPTHTYLEPGTYTVTLQVTNSAGTGSQHQQVTLPPIADFTWEKLEEGRLQFWDASRGDVTSWSWDFGEGGKSTERDPIHIFLTPGVYPVVLEVEGPDGSGRAEYRIELYF